MKKMTECKKLNDIFVNNIRHIQAECGITNNVLADKIGISKSHFCRKMSMTEQCNFNIYEMKIIAKELSESLDDMLEPIFIKKEEIK